MEWLWPGEKDNGFGSSLPRRRAEDLLRHSQQSLRESEEKFRGIAERSFDAIFTTDPQGTITYLSPAVEKIFQFKPEEMVGKHFTAFMVEEDRAGAYQAFVSALKKQPSGLFEGQGPEERRKSGRHRSQFCESLGRGEVVGLQGVIRDVTERQSGQGQGWPTWLPSWNTTPSPSWKRPGRKRLLRQSVGDTSFSRRSRTRSRASRGWRTGRRPLARSASGRALTVTRDVAVGERQYTRCSSYLAQDGLVRIYGPI